MHVIAVYRSMVDKMNEINSDAAVAPSPIMYWTSIDERSLGASRNTSGHPSVSGWHKGHAHGVQVLGRG